MASIADLPKKSSGKGSIGPREDGNPRWVRVTKCVEWLKTQEWASGWDNARLYQTATAWELKGILGSDGKPDADKIPGGGGKMAEALPVGNVPMQDQPAWGWLENLRVVGSSLFADIRSIPAKLADVIRAKRYRMRSVEMQRGTPDKPYRGRTGWVLQRLALLGQEWPAVTLRDLPEIDADGNIDGVEILRTGTWNGMQFTDADLAQIVDNAREIGLPIPLKLGHSDWAVAMSEGATADNIEIQAAPEVPAGNDAESITHQRRVDDMDETKLNELTARLAEQEQAKVSLEAKLAEKDAKLTDMERQLADLHAQRRVDDVDRAIARLSEPVDGVALPIPALVDAGLRDLALLLHGGRVQLSEGKSPLGLLGDVLAQVRKSGVVRVVPQLQMSEGDGDDPAKAAYESAGGESLGITLDEWRAGAAAFDGGVK